MSVVVLVIDPDNGVLKAAGDVLTAEGLHVVTATDAAGGLRKLQEARPALVLLEVVMPGKDGIECLLEIKRGAPQTNVLAMSGGQGRLAGDYLLHMATRLGADAVLAKPFSESDLLSEVRRLLPAFPFRRTAQ